MGKGAGTAPDYQGAAERTAQSSQQAVGAQTLANRPNITTPFGSQQWTQGPDGSWQMSTALNGGLGSAAQGLQGQIGSALSQPFGFGGLGQLGNGDTARNQAIDASFRQSDSRLNPLFAARENALRGRTANQGIDPNSQAGRSATEALGRERNDAYQGAMNSAIASGQAAGDSVFHNNLAARQQGINELVQARQQPIQDLQQLQSFLSMPGFQGAGAANPTNYYGAAQDAGQWQLQDAQMKNQFWSDLAGGIFGAARSAVPFAFPRRTGG